MNWAPLSLSLQIAALAMVVSVVAGTALAILLDWKKLPGRELLYTLLLAPLVLPPTVLGYYLLVVLGHDSVIGRAFHAVTGGTIVFSFTGAVIAAAVGSLPLVVRAARLGIEAVDGELRNAARTLGASPTRVMLTVVLPLAAPALAAGSMLAFARALGDYGITQMVAGQLPETASIHVMNAMYAWRDTEARNMSIATTIVGLTLLYVANRLVKKYTGGHV